MDPSWVILNHLRAIGFWTKGGDSGHPQCTRADLGGAPPSDDHAGEISRRVAAGRARIEPAKQRRQPPWVTGNFPLFRPFQAISGQPIPHFHHFLDPLNSFLWSIFADSSPFESYDENKVGRRLDRVFRPPQRLLYQVNGTDEFLVSWAFH